MVLPCSAQPPGEAANDMQKADLPVSGLANTMPNSPGPIPKTWRDRVSMLNLNLALSVLVASSSWLVVGGQ